MLLKKLDQQQDEMLNFEQFSQLFNFDLQRQENFDLLFDIFDTKKKGYITLDDLKAVNVLYSSVMTFITRVGTIRARHADHDTVH